LNRPAGDECLLQVAGAAIGLTNSFNGDHAAVNNLGSQYQT